MSTAVKAHLCQVLNNQIDQALKKDLLDIFAE